MKTKKELNALKEEVEALKVKFSTLTDEELTQVTGGIAPSRAYRRDRSGQSKENP